jgi:hypothetical protein
MRKKLTLTSTVLAAALAALGGLMALAASPQNDRQARSIDVNVYKNSPQQERREIDLRARFVGKKFHEGRNTIETFPNGDAIIIEIWRNKFRDILLVTADGHEVKGTVNDPSGGRSERKKGDRVSQSVACTATFITTTTDKKGNTKTTTNVVQIQCPSDIDGLGGQDTFQPPSNSNSNSAKPRN